MFPNWSGWKTVKLALTGIGIAASAIAASSSMGAAVQAIASTVGAIDGSVLAVVVVLSGTSMGPALVRK
jgi:hypothetical protein